MVQALQLLAWTWPGVKRPLASACPHQRDPEHFWKLCQEPKLLAATRQQCLRATEGCVPPPAIHIHRLLLAEVPGYTYSFPTVTRAPSCLYWGWWRPRSTSLPLFSWSRDLTQPLQALRRDLNSNLQCLEPSFFAYSFPGATGVNGVSPFIPRPMPLQASCSDESIDLPIFKPNKTPKADNRSLHGWVGSVRVSLWPWVESGSHLPVKTGNNCPSTDALCLGTELLSLAGFHPGAFTDKHF